MQERGHIAVVDDEQHIRETVAFALRREGHVVDVYEDGQAAWTALSAGLPEITIVDIMMPRMDGLELCRRLRSRSAELPIVFLSSKDEEFDRVLGLELGADDYLCKPFSMRELAARIRVLLRRLALLEDRSTAVSILRRGPLELDLDRYSARVEDRDLSLTVTEFRVLHSLARHPGHVKTRAQLMRDGYPDDAYVSERTIDSHIKRIRRKLEAVAPGHRGVETVHGLGYRYQACEGTT